MTDPDEVARRLDERKERELLAALDAGLASRRAKPGVWDRVNAKVRRTRK